MSSDGFFGARGLSWLANRQSRSASRVHPRVEVDGENKDTVEQVAVVTGLQSSAHFPMLDH